MSATIPRLVADTETGLVCIQICRGAHSATLPLPEHLQKATPAEVQAFVERMVPLMIDGLNERQAEDRRKLRKAARNV